jgi:hypothetical protein
VSERSAGHARHGGSGAKGGAKARGDKAKALQVPLPSPGGSLGSRRARQGQPGTRPLTHAVCVCQAEHGRRRARGQGAWAGGKGAPNATPRPARRVGGGRGVGGRSRRPHGASAPWRRPLASGRLADTGRGRTKSPATAHAGHEPNARACWRNGMQHGGTAVDAIAMETDASERVLWRSPRGVAPGAVKAARTVLNGGDEATCSNGTRLVPTQLRQQVSASVGLYLDWSFTGRMKHGSHDERMGPLVSGRNKHSYP